MIINMEKKPKTARKPIWAKLMKGLVWLLLFLILIICIGAFLANRYLNSNKEKILDNLAFLNNGSIIFKEADLSIYKNFPEASITLTDVHLHDSLYYQHNQELLQIGEMEAILDLDNWRNEEVGIKGVTIRNGNIQLTTLQNGYNLLNSIIRKKNQDAIPTKDDEKKKSVFRLNTEDIDVKLYDTDISILDSVKTQYIIIHANKLEALLNIEDGEILADIDLDLDVDQLTFKEKIGSYLSESTFKTSLHAEYGNNNVIIDSTNLFINEGSYFFEGNINLNKTGPTILHLKNDQTLLTEVLPLLTDNIAKVIDPYEITGAFQTDTEIILNPGDPAKVIVDFEMKENDFKIQNIPFQESSLQGRFINRSEDRPDYQQLKHGSIYLHLKDVETHHNTFKLKTPEAIIRSNPVDKASIKSIAEITGPASGISEWYKNEKVVLESGHFALNVDIHGQLNQTNKLIEDSEATLELDDINIWFKPSDTSIPVKSVHLKKESGDVRFGIRSTTLLNSHDYQLDGGLSNLLALFNEVSGITESSDVKLYASKLSWEDFVDLFSQRSIQTEKAPKSEVNSKMDMKRTIQMIQTKFNPHIALSVDTFHYQNKLELYNVGLDVKFIDEHNLELGPIQFKLSQGDVFVDLKLNISHPNQTVFDFDLETNNINLQELLPKFGYFNNDLLKSISDLPDDLNLQIKMNGVIDDVKGLLANTASGNIHFNSDHHDHLNGNITFSPNKETQTQSTQLILNGSPHLFNDFFKTEQFHFQEQGRFNVNFDYVGDVRSFEHLVDEAKVDFLVEDVAIQYAAADVIFQFDTIKLDYHKDTAFYMLNLYADSLDREVHINGDMDNISSLLFPDADERLSTNIDIYSPLINLSHALHIFETKAHTNSNQNKEHRVDNKVKNLIQKVFGRFDPKIAIKVDSFVVNDNFQFSHFHTGLEMKDSSKLVLDETEFFFHKGKIDLNAIVDVSSEDESPFEATFATEELPLSNLLESLNYLGSKSMQNADSLDGRITLTLDLNGRLQGLTLLKSSINGELDFNVHDLRIEGVDLIDRIASKLYATRFLHDLRFAPITNQIRITGSQIDIPQMEIMSSGLDFFIEGHIDNNAHTNLWLSVPLDNLTRVPTNISAPKRGYEGSKRKIYVELSTGEYGKLKTKIRTNKKKYFEQRDSPELFKQYKTDIKANRKKLRKNRNKSNTE